ncbi:putative transcription factor bZIP family [Helianthus annuus]|nr:putative transcription factor bZIP family [Helianthus annuus]
MWDLPPTPPTSSSPLYLPHSSPPPPYPPFTTTNIHTCYHVHTKILPALSNDENIPTAESLVKKTKIRSLGNREAVRKYHEKKKVRAASLEDEVVRLRALNQQLMKRIQSQIGLESEVRILKCLLVDIRRRIDGKIWSFIKNNIRLIRVLLIRI